MISKNSEKKNEIEELNNITCPLCFAKLIFKSLNKSYQILACSNKDCLFPLDNANMDKFIININNYNLNSFLSNLKNFFLEQSYASDTNIEDKLKKYKNEKFDSNNDDLSDIALDVRSFSNILSQNDLYNN